MLIRQELFTIHQMNSNQQVNYANKRSNMIRMVNLQVNSAIILNILLMMQIGVTRRLKIWVILLGLKKHSTMYFQIQQRNVQITEHLE